MKFVAGGRFIAAEDLYARGASALLILKLIIPIGMKKDRADEYPPGEYREA
jgi:hypothetical protein